MLILQDLHESFKVVTEMAHKYTYPVIDPALRNFLVLVLMFLVIVTVAATIGDAFDIFDALLPGLRTTGEDPFLQSQTPPN